MPAGWYPDPSNPAQVRYWDGSAWTAHVAPAPAAGWGTPAPLDPQRDLDAELRTARYARISTRAGAALYLVYFICVAIVGGRLLHEFRKAVDQIQLNPNSNPTPFGDHPGYLVSAILTFDGFGFVLLAVQVILMIWLFNAATFAQRAGIPARHTPIWAAIGFIIPVINLWFPYQCAADLFEPGDSRRRIVGWWWACWLLDGFLLWPILFASWFSIPAAVLVAVVAAVVPLAGARFALALIDGSEQAHRARMPHPLTQR